MEFFTLVTWITVQFHDGGVTYPHYFYNMTQPACVEAMGNAEKTEFEHNNKKVKVVKSYCVKQVAR